MSLTEKLIIALLSGTATTAAVVVVLHLFTLLTTPGPDTDTLHACYTRCADIRDTMEHPPAGWEMLQTNPCHCGINVESVLGR